MSHNHADKTEEIKLGGVKYAVRPLPWGVLKKILPLFAEAPRGVFSPEGGEAFSKILVAALGRDYPDFTTEFLDGIECPFQDIVDAVDVIGRVAGLVKPKGEAEAGESL